MKTELRNYFGIFMMGLIIIGGCWGCAGVGQKFNAWQAAFREKLGDDKSEEGDVDARDADEAYFVHTSEWSWETLELVAQWYTGDARNAELLADINPDVNSEKIAFGTEVEIPAELLQTRQPMPKNFSAKSIQGYYKHTVRWPGESLSLIASWYTGSSKNWQKLAQANPRLNPNRIRGGDVIFIPSRLLKTRVPLPQKVAAKYSGHYFVYKVKKDQEKLADIARWYTGDSANRTLLARANPDLNPDDLKKGNEVFIPKKLLIARPAAIPPKAASGGSTSAVKSAAPEPETAQLEDENIKLFGPKQFPKQ